MVIISNCSHQFPLLAVGLITQHDSVWSLFKLVHAVIWPFHLEQVTCPWHSFELYNYFFPINLHGLQCYFFSFLYHSVIRSYLGLFLLWSFMTHPKCSGLYTEVYLSVFFPLFVPVLCHPFSPIWDYMASSWSMLRTVHFLDNLWFFSYCKNEVHNVVWFAFYLAYPLGLWALCTSNSVITQYGHMLSCCISTPLCGIWYYIFFSY